MSTKTIVALATPPMNSALHIIRISGDNVYPIINKIFDRKVPKEGYTIQYGYIVDNKKKIDNVLIMKFVSPKSFTGEDMVEINCHGGIYLAKKIIELLIKKGCVLAERGEFSKRAFMNKKINVNQAHAINNLINSTNDYSVQNAIKGLDPKTYELSKKITDELFTVLGQIEVNIDYPEYDDVPEIDAKTLLKKLTNVTSELEKVVLESKKVELLNKGIKMAIVGKPNVGKSTLMNLLSKEQKSIVSSVSGTTRDSISNNVNIAGITFNLVDTAGIKNKTSNKIEKIGIKQSIDSINKSDITLFIFDASKKNDKIDNEIYELVKNKPHIVIGNKIDKGKMPNNFRDVIYISTKDKIVDNLYSAISNKVKSLKLDNNNSLIIQNANDIGTIENCVSIIHKSMKLLLEKTNIDVVSSDLHYVYLQLLKIFDYTENYDFIDDMFKKFCLGK